MRPRWRTIGSGPPGASNTSKATRPSECIFCSKPALATTSEALIAHRGERCFVMLNAFPYNNGHVMVAPYEHTGDLPDSTDATAAELMALAQRSLRALERRLRARGIQRRRQPGHGRRRRRRGPRPPARRAALGGRHELHAGARRHAGAAAEPRGQLPRAARGLRARTRRDGGRSPGIFKAYDVRGIYPDQIDEQRRLPASGARSRACCRPARRRQRAATACSVAVGHDMRLHSPALAERLRARPGRRGLRRARHRDGRHRDGLLRRRLARARRRRVRDRLAQPEAVGRLQAGARGGDRRFRATAASRTCGGCRDGDFSDARPARARTSGATSTRSSSATCSASSTPR